MSLIGDLNNLSFINDLTSPGNFTPAQLTNLAFWIKADLGVTITGGKVSQWNDQSNTDSHKNLTQPISANRPTLNTSDPIYNNHNSISFNSASDGYMISGTLNTTIVQPNTVFIVGNTDGSPSTFEVFMDSHDPVVEQAIFGSGSTGQYDVFGNSSFASGVSVKSTPVIICCVFNDPNSSMRISQLTINNTGTVSGSSLPTIVVGAFNDTTAPLNGKIAEIILYSRQLSVSEINQVMRYLSNEYAITLGN